MSAGFFFKVPPPRAPYESVKVHLSNLGLGWAAKAGGWFYIYLVVGDLVTIPPSVQVFVVPVAALDVAAVFSGGPPDQSSNDLFAFELEIGVLIDWKFATLRS